MRYCWFAGLGLRSLTEKIDKDSDLIQYINSYHGRSGKLQKNDIQYKEYSMVCIG